MNLASARLTPILLRSPGLEGTSHRRSRTIVRRDYTAASLRLRRCARRWRGCQMLRGAIVAILCAGASLAAAQIFLASAVTLPTGPWGRPAQHAQMPPFGALGVLTQRDARDLTEYVVALSHEPADDAAVLRAMPMFGSRCAGCHGGAGEGDASRGVPALTDPFRFGDQARKQILDIILRGHGGDEVFRMPPAGATPAHRPT